MFLKKNNASAGMTLVEMMVATGISGVLFMGIAAYLSQQQRTVKEMESNLRMNTIAQSVQQAIAKPAHIRASADFDTQPGNMKLAACINPVVTRSTTLKFQPAAGCTSTDPLNPVAFDFVLANNLPPSPPATPVQLEANTIAGESNNPALYKLLDGSHCTPRQGASTACNVKVTAYFWATCPAGPNSMGNQAANDTEITAPTAAAFAPASCSTAQTIHILYQVAYKPAVPQTGFWSLNIGNVPADKVFWADYPTNSKISTIGSITIPVSTIPGPSNGVLQCPTNSSIIGVKDGVPQCQCIFPYKPAPGCLPGETCACIDISEQCLPTERYRGINLNGDIICCPVYCQTVTVDWSGGATGCALGGWIESITPNQAFYNSNGPHNNSCAATSKCALAKWGGTCNAPVTCVEDITCCYEYAPPGSPPGTFSAGCNIGH